MVGPDASLIQTEMVKFQTVRDWADEGQVGDPVSGFGALVANAERPVAAGLYGPGPQPAVVCPVDLRPEPSGLVYAICRVLGVRETKAATV